MPDVDHGHGLPRPGEENVNPGAEAASAGNRRRLGGARRRMRGVAVDGQSGNSVGRTAESAARCGEQQGREVVRTPVWRTPRIVAGQLENRDPEGRGPTDVRVGHAGPHGREDARRNARCVLGPREAAVRNGTDESWGQVWNPASSAAMRGMTAARRRRPTPGASPTPVRTLARRHGLDEPAHQGRERHAAETACGAGQSPHCRHVRCGIEVGWQREQRGLLELDREHREGDEHDGHRRRPARMAGHAATHSTAPTHIVVIREA